MRHEVVVEAGLERADHHALLVLHDHLVPLERLARHQAHLGHVHLGVDGRVVVDHDVFAVGRVGRRDPAQLGPVPHGTGVRAVTEKALMRVFARLPFW